MTPAQQRRAKTLLKKLLIERDRFDSGNSVEFDTSQKLTTETRTFLIQIGSISDRRKDAK